jgi:hypothetical protein
MTPNRVCAIWSEEQALLKASCDHRQNQAEKTIAPPLPRRRGASSSAQGYGVTSRRDMGFHQLMTEDLSGKVSQIGHE